MEGVGSRLGRTSSRYGGQAPTVFNGPVRRWKKKWVHVSSSSSSVTYQQNPQSQSNGHNNNNSNSSRLLLCRWTPISPAPNSAATAAEPHSGSGSQTEEPPRRKFRYTPVAVLEEQKKAVEKKVEDVEKTSEGDQSTAMSDKTHGKSNTDNVLKNEAEELDKNQSGLEDSDMSHLDLDLGLKGNNGNPESIGQIKEGQMKKVGSGGFWLG